MRPLGTGRTKALATRQYTECCRRRSRLRTSAGIAPESKYFRNDTDQLRARLEFDPPTAQIARFCLMQGTNRPWRDAFRAALDSTLKDAAGRPVEGITLPRRWRHQGQSPQRRHGPHPGNTRFRPTGARHRGMGPARVVWRAAEKLDPAIGED
jgi:hypothetical protein